MKKFLVAVVVVALALPALAWSANIASGKYDGKIQSVLPELNGKTIKAEVKQAGTKTEATVTYDNGDKEVWTWDGAVLDQVELDKTGKEVQKYGAKFNSGKYEINCADKVANKCDAGVDKRNYWTINSTPNSFTYEVWGVGKDKMNDAAAAPAKRHTFTFNLTPAPAATTATAAPATTPAPAKK